MVTGLAGKMFAGFFYALGKEKMNPRIEKVRDDIKRTEGKLRELEEYLKTLRIREKQLCDEELIKVMRSMAGRDGDVIAMLDAFVSSQGESDTEEKSTSIKADYQRGSLNIADSDMEEKTGNEVEDDDEE